MGVKATRKVRLASSAVVERNTSLFGSYRIEFPAGVVEAKSEMEELALEALVAAGQGEYVTDPAKKSKATDPGEG